MANWKVDVGRGQRFKECFILFRLGCKCCVFIRSWWSAIRSWSGVTWGIFGSRAASITNTTTRTPLETLAKLHIWKRLPRISVMEKLDAISTATLQETPQTSNPTPPQPDVQCLLHLPRILQLPNPDLNMLLRNTLTNMVSIVRATATEFMYPSKNDVQAMAKRLVEYYPMLRDTSVNCKHTWELLFKQLMKRLHNIKTPKKRQGPTPQRQRKRKQLDSCYG
ncbi:hypothetical protein MHYP_G00042730 [Metynnis hypsauchen]